MKNPDGTGKVCARRETACDESMPTAGVRENPFEQPASVGSYTDSGLIQSKARRITLTVRLSRKNRILGLTKLINLMGETSGVCWSSSTW
ncbi:hypothetical protein SAMN05920897_106147 [Alkalispirochaeta americana]|uniref:Uncharacterized protein n=1 Tax=Alkalispirochaeta americana TaxID=159291 RepID=A0A1N6RKP3_9SPIO|nr:hypothetical protein SAMN05920897_106147 [Alkalispirochaeta americana]